MGKQKAKRKVGKARKVADLSAKKAKDVVGGSLSLNFTKIAFTPAPQRPD